MISSCVKFSASFNGSVRWLTQNVACWHKNMASSEDVMECQSKHEILADFIKNVHGNLRRNVRKAHGDFQTVWREHCKDEAQLKRYAETMKELAVEHWRGNNLRRIEWCREICVEFFHGGGYEKCLRKDCRRILMNLHDHQDCSCAKDAEAWQQTLTRGLVKKSKLLLLDVGSCFNPFQAYMDTFIPVAIDLCPADKTVFASDFLQLDIYKQSDLRLSKKNCKNASLLEFAASESPSSLFPEEIQVCINGGDIKQLPEDSFDVVVFCLLLSYFPATSQRWECCKKAHKLLTDGGLLIIITPDSSHQNKNVKMIKSWKTAIESIGFARWKYHKDTHTHCMAFRKKTLCANLVQKEEMLSGLSGLLYIHQDLQEVIEEENDNSAHGTDSVQGDPAESSRALPFLCTDI